MNNEEQANYKRLGFKKMESFDIKNCTLPIVMDNGKLRIVDAIDTETWTGRYLILNEDNDIIFEFASHDRLISYCEKMMK